MKYKGGRGGGKRLSDGEVRGGEATFERQRCPRGAAVKFEGVATFERVAMFDVCRGDDV